MKKLILLCVCLAIAGFAFATPSFANEMRRSQYKSEYNYGGKATPLSIAAAQRRWQELRPAEREAITKSQHWNWSDMTMGEWETASNQSQRRWEKMTLDERKDLIRRYQSAQSVYTNAPLNADLEDQVDFR